MGKVQLTCMFCQFVWCSIDHRSLLLFPSSPQLAPINKQKLWEVSEGKGEKKPLMCLPLGHILNGGFICRPYSLPSCSGTFVQQHELANLQYSILNFLKISPSLHTYAFTCKMSHLWAYSFWFPVLCCFGYQHEGFLWLFPSRMQCHKCFGQMFSLLFVWLTTDNRQVLALQC